MEQNQIRNVDSSRIIDAVRIWSGWGICSWPCRDDSRLDLEYGTAEAATLLPIIKGLEEDFYLTDANLKLGEELAEMGEVAKTQFRLLHPEVSEEIADVLRWCYTYDFR